MNFKKDISDLYIPDDVIASDALTRTTHLAIGAHQDDLEIFAYHGIAECYQKKDKWFGGVVVTDGSGSARTGVYSDYTNEEMIQVRILEQRKAAFMGDYSFVAQLAHPSSEIKDSANALPSDEIEKILLACEPEVLYLHNPADKHPTHIAVLKSCLTAIRNLPKEKRPKVVYGCEVWRDLDWVLDEDKVALDSSLYPNLASSLVGIFDSQISGGKRYDLATTGRRLANATYYDPHSVDEITAITWALDMSVLCEDDSLSLHDYTMKYVNNFSNSVSGLLK